MGISCIDDVLYQNQKQTLTIEEPNEKNSRNSE